MTEVFTDLCEIEKKIISNLINYIWNNTLFIFGKLTLI